MMDIGILTNGDIITNLSKTNQELGNLTKITLKQSTMSTLSTDNKYRTYYGEYKLPNSTIAVTSDAKITDKSKILKDGYIGVKFDIISRHIGDGSGSLNEEQSVITYSTKLDKSAASNNVTQWDYESYMGAKYDKAAAIKMKLEKGIWIIDDDYTNDNTKYNDIKGTVVLFDLDARAATDFN